MFPLTITAALSALAALTSITTATPLTPTTTLPLTKSYRLYINTTSPPLDFPYHPVKGLYVTTVRAGATINAITVTNTTSSASLFSTTNHSTTQLSHSLKANFSLGAYSIYMADAGEPNPHVLNLGVNGGNGTQGIYTTGRECTTLATDRVGTFAVCDEGFDAYTHPRWLVVFVEGGDLPETCVAVSLVPECDGFDPLPGVLENGIVESRCWADVGSVGDWGDYGC